MMRETAVLDPSGRHVMIEEARAAEVTSSDPRLAELLGLSTGDGQVPTVSLESALSLPAIWCAVNFLAGTLATLPVRAFEADPATGLKRELKATTVAGKAAALLNGPVNDETTGFDFRKGFYDDVLTGGRGLAWIETNSAGRALNLWWMLPGKTEVRRERLRTSYLYREAGGRQVTYQAAEVLDVAFMLRPDKLGVRSPVLMCRDAIARGIAAQRRGAAMFGSSGLPYATLEGPFDGGASAGRAAADIYRNLIEMHRRGENILAMPLGHKLNALGMSAEQMQAEELERLTVEEVARIYQLPPMFLQDLSRGTYSNTEQQDLHLVKHTLNRHAIQFGQQATLKLLGRNSKAWLELDLASLIRGDFKTRVDAIARAVHSALMTPNEGRAWLNGGAPHEEGAGLFIQGATVPLGMAGAIKGQPAMPGATEEGES